MNNVCGLRSRTTGTKFVTSPVSIRQRRFRTGAWSWQRAASAVCSPRPDRHWTSALVCSLQPSITSPSQPGIRCDNELHRAT